MSFLLIYMYFFIFGLLVNLLTFGHLFLGVIPIFFPSSLSSSAWKKGGENGQLGKKG